MTAKKRVTRSASSRATRTRTWLPRMAKAEKPSNLADAPEIEPETGSEMNTETELEDEDVVDLPASPTSVDDNVLDRAKVINAPASAGMAARISGYMFQQGTCLTCYKRGDLIPASSIPDTCRERCFAHICRDCMELYLKDHFKFNMDDKNWGFKCPMCTQVWGISAIKEFWDDATIATYLERLTHKSLEQSPLFRWCAADRCVTGQFYDEAQLKDEKKICCGVCSSVNCFDCRVVWHEGLSCAENQNPDLRKHRGKRPDLEMRKCMRKSVTKRCPHCGAAVEKTHGCNTVLCKSDRAMARIRVVRPCVSVTNASCI